MLTEPLQRSLPHIQALAAQCRSYPGGPLGAAVYLPLVKREPQEGSQEANGNIRLSADNAALLHNATVTLEALFREMETEAPHASSSAPSPACSLRLLLLYELVGDEMLAALMPINALRNAAFLAADTPLVAMVDVDLSPSWSLAGQVLADSESAKLSELLPMWKPRGLIHQFARDVYKAGHTATNFEKWFRFPTEYEVPYKKGYEPWFIGARLALPEYDARFRGYSWNKVINVQHMAALGFSFHVLPDAWLEVKVNGTRWNARDIFLRRTKRFYRTSERLLEAGTYRPVVDAASRHCRKVLPWWQQRAAGGAA
ncbi:hypothetical protein PLESTF_001370300 [Pleodorina starrii]|nr:hypothetical protein PLESTF_001370300 [Pleodorina starrii]